MNFRKTDQRIEEMIETERDYVKSLNYIIKVKISFFLTSKTTQIHPKIALTDPKPTRFEPKMIKNDLFDTKMTLNDPN